MSLYTLLRTVFDAKNHQLRDSLNSKTNLVCYKIFNYEMRSQSNLIFSKTFFPTLSINIAKILFLKLIFSILGKIFNL